VNSDQREVKFDMNLIKTKLTFIQSTAIEGDDEVAHIREDELREMLIAYVSQGHFDSAELVEMAKLVLSTNDLEFCRWCA